MKDNTTAQILKKFAIGIGAIGILGSIIWGVVVGQNYYIASGTGFIISIIGSLSSFITALLLYAAGEAIQLLQNINDKVSNNDPAIPTDKAGEKAIDYDQLPKL